MRRYWLSALMLVTAIILLVGYVSFVKAASTSSTINVHLTVPSAGDGGTGGPPPPPPPTDNPPVIASVVSSTSYTTAQINWSVTDDKGISSVLFVYGLTPAYGSSGAVTGSGTYQVNLTGLATGTVYYFKISATDTGAHTTESALFFRTRDYSPPDITPPAISSIQTATGFTTSSVSWQTNENADSQVNYGLTGAYGSVVADAALSTSHSLLIFNLLPNTTYHYRVVSADAAANSAASADQTFKTLKDAVPPPDVSGLAVATTSNDIILNWNNPSTVVTPDFIGVKILRKVGSRSNNTADGTAVYTGGAETFTDENVLKNIDYFYTVFSYDTSGNYSAGAFKSGKLTTPTPVEVCGNGLDDDGNGKIDCADDACKNLPACGQPVSEICNNGIDDDGDGQTDCADSDCVADPSCASRPAEICDNNIDDDGDSKIDCVDSDCAASPFCRITPPGSEICDNNIDDDNDGKIDCADSDCGSSSFCLSRPPISEICNNNIDDDGDDKIDCADSDCAVASVCQGAAPSVGPITTTPSSVPSFARLSLSDVAFYTGRRQIKISPAGDAVSGLALSDLTVAIAKNVLPSLPVSLVMKVDGKDSHQLALSAVDNIYYTDFSFPSVGQHTVFLEVDYGAGQFDSVAFNLNSLGWGSVTDDQGKPLQDAQIALFREGEVKPAEIIFTQPNPALTNGNGNYGWTVPNGRYFLVAGKKGYYQRELSVFVVANNSVNASFGLVLIPKTLSEAIDPNASLGQNVRNVAQNLVEKAKAATELTAQDIVNTAKAVQEVTNRPEVQNAASNIVAPAAVGVATISTVVVLSWVNFLPFLRLLFLQPLLLLGLRKREKWGQIYNSLNKLPIDLAMVRLINQDTGRLLQSKVTDKLGRYAFVTNPGKYRLEAVKASFVFPSAMLSGYQNDGRRVDIYHGEVIDVSDNNALVTANIPLDPVGAFKKPKRLILEKFGRSVQSFVSGLGLVVTLVSLYISPKWYVWVLLGVHVGLGLLFKRLSHLPQGKGWGIVYDKDTKRPVGRTVARLFNSQFNKLVATQITDNRGRYYFMAGDDKYYVTYEHAAYETHTSEIIDLSGKETETVAFDVALRKKQGAASKTAGAQSSGTKSVVPPAPMAASPQLTPIAPAVTQTAPSQLAATTPPQKAEEKKHPNESIFG